jgi:hypothetical protein
VWAGIRRLLLLLLLLLLLAVVQEVSKSAMLFSGTIGC